MKRLLAIIALIAPMLASAQPTVGTGTPAAYYRTNTLQLPFLTLAASTATNIAGGWTNTVNVTNNVVVYTNAAGGGTPGFVTNQIVTTNTTVSYCQFDAEGQRNVGLEFSTVFSQTAVATNNTVWIALSCDGVNFDTNNNVKIISWPGTGTTPSFVVTNIDMVGYGFGRIFIVTNGTAGATMTNNYPAGGANPASIGITTVKRNAP